MSPSIGSRGCVVLLIDESAAMQSAIARMPGASAGKVKSKAESAATAVNSLLQKVARGVGLDVAIVGYRTDADGQVNVGPRWGDSLAGRRFVESSQWRDAPLRVEQRERLRGGQGEFVEFPVWYEPHCGGTSPQVAAFAYCRDLLTDRRTSGGSTDGAIIFHITAGPGDDGNPKQVIDELTNLDGWSTPPLIFHVHLGSHDSVPASLLPANRAYLAVGPVRELFERSSELPQFLIDPLKSSGVPVLRGARGMAFNARLLELVQLLSVVTTAANHWAGADLDPPALDSAIPSIESAPIAAREPAQSAAYSGDASSIPAHAEAPPLEPGSVTAENPALVLLVTDRSVEDPFRADLNNTYSKVHNALGTLVQLLSQQGGSAIDVAVVSYGANLDGSTDVQTTLQGGLQGQTFARSDKLRDGAVRFEESFQEESNGVGGLLRIPQHRLHLVEFEPTGPAPALPAFQQVREVITKWAADHPGSASPPMVIHVTRGQFDAADIQTAADWLADGTSVRPLLYHLVMTEQDAPTLEFCHSADQIADPKLKHVWHATSPLFGREELAAERDNISIDSRGFVVNGRMRLALEPLLRAIAE